MSTAHYMEALAFKAPYLIDKLLKEQIVDTAEDGEALLAEVIRYFILDRCYPKKHWEMMSRRIDEVWHQFVLFTHEYIAFCQRYFGSYVHHFPGNSPSAIPQDNRESRPASVASAMADFRTHYESTFGMPLPALWHDRASITVSRRLLVEKAFGPLMLEARPESDMVTLRCHKGVILSVSSMARDALELIIRARSFYVRELPGDLTDEEKIGIVDTLVAQRVLLVAP